MKLTTHLDTYLKMKIISTDKPVTLQSDGYTFLLIQSGKLRSSGSPDSEIYAASDTLILLPEEKIKITPLTPFDIISLDFDRSLLDNLIPRGYTLTCDPEKTDANDRSKLYELLHSFSDYYDKPGHILALTGKVYLLLDLLVQAFILPCSYEKDINSMDPDLVAEDIKRYIAANYRSPLTAKEVSAALYISPRYLSGIFHDRLGTTFNKYLSGVRLSHAAQDLEETDQTVTDIALGNGFSGISAFFRLFNNTYGCTPTSYRKKIRAAHTSQAIPAVPDVPDKIAAFDIPFSQCSPSYASWSDTINAGDLKNALSRDFHELFPNAQKSLHFRYVRFTNIFSSEFLPKECWESKEYQFTRLDYILDLLIKNHALPFFDLGMKMSEEELAAAPELPPVSVRMEYLDAMIRHCITRYNISLISGFRFELWAKTMEDLAPAISADEYADIFARYRNIIKALAPDAAFGGPGFNTASDPEVFCDYLQSLSASGAVPDFVSVYIYPFEPVIVDAVISGKKTPIRLLSSDPDHALSVFRKYKKLCRDIMGELPVFVTEISPGRIGTNHIGASAFSAAWICHNFISLYTETDCLAYWNLFDHDIALPMVPRPYSIGSGLFGKRGIQRPSFFAMGMMNRMKSRTFMVSPDIICATNGTSLFQLLIVNYSHYAKNYCCSWYRRIPVIETYDALEPGSDKSYCFSLSELPPGHYRTTRDRLTRRRGSVLDLYIEIVTHGNLTPDEIEYYLNNPKKEDLEYYSRHVAPLREVSYLDVSDDFDTPVIEVTLEPHEVSFIELERKWTY